MCAAMPGLLLRRSWPCRRGAPRPRSTPSSIPSSRGSTSTSRACQLAGCCRPPHARYLTVAGLPRASIGMIEVYFSIFQRKLLTPADFVGPADLKRGWLDGIPRALSTGGKAIQVDLHPSRPSRPPHQASLVPPRRATTWPDRCQGSHAPSPNGGLARAHLGGHKGWFQRSAFLLPTSPTNPREHRCRSALIWINQFVQSATFHAH